MKEHYGIHKDKLKGEYLQTFDKIELYSLVDGLDSDIYQERMMDLVDMFITAQAKRMPVEKIVGDDVEAFCQTYFADYTLKERLKKLPGRYIWSAWFVFVFELLCIWPNIQSGVSFWDAKSNIEPYLIGLVAGIVLVGFISALFKPMVFRIKWLTATMFEIAVLIILIGGFLLLFSFDAQMILSIPACPAWIVLLVAGVYILIYHSVKIYQNCKKYGTPWKPKEKYSFTESINASVEEQLPGELKKKFEKKNKKRLKANKLLQTPQEFMAELRKEVKQENIVGYICLIVVILFCVYQGIWASREHGILGGVIYVGILLLIEIPVCKLFFSLDGNSPKKKVLDTCDRLGITVIEFAEKLEEGTINIYGESMEDDLSNFYDGEWENPIVSQDDPEAKV